MISVIIPNYNHAPYLVERIESVLNQTYQDFELILFDDHSTDGSVEILNNYASHPKVSSIVINKENSGTTFKQWQKGIDIAKGEYIWIAESDDVASPFFIETLLPVLQKDPTLSLVYCDSIEIDGNGSPTGFVFSDYKNKETWSQHWSKDYFINGKEEIRSYLSKFCSINNASSVIFRKEYLTRYNMPDTSLRYVGDWKTYITLALVSNIAYIHQPLNLYRNHSNNASKKGSINHKLMIEELQVYNLVLKSHIFSFKEIIYYKERIRKRLNSQNITDEIKKNEAFLFYNTKSLLTYVVIDSMIKCKKALGLLIKKK